jgi:glycosyltransferase involved in cell wall biosynthesis
MPDSRLHIWLDAERMKYPHTGLYHFCKELGTALAASRTDKEELTFYLPGELEGCFGKEVNYLSQQIIHKLYLPALGKIDVWHALQQDSDYYPRHRIIPTVLTIHDLNFLHQPGKSSSSVKRALNRLQSKVSRAQSIVTISGFVLQELKEHVNIGSIPSSVIYNGCNYSSVLPREPKTVPNRPFLFTIGTVAAKKNFHVLPALLEKNDDLLIIAGLFQDENYLATIQSEAKRFGVADRVIFTGAISEEEKQWYYSQCKAFVFPSLAEGFGMPVLEAMYFGKPVFLSTHTSLPEVGGNRAYYFESFDPQEMQQVLERGLQHYVSNSPAEMIKAHAMSFSWMTAAKKYIELYHQLAGDSI